MNYLLKQADLITRLLLLTLFSLLLLLISGCDEQDQKNSSAQNNDHVTSQSATSQNKSNKPRVKREVSSLTPFTILSSYEGQYEQAPALQINFSLPLDDQQDIGALIDVTTKSTEKVNGDWVLSDNRQAIYFPFIEAEVSYRLRVDKKLASINGKRLKDNFSKTLKTMRQQKKVRFLSKGSTLLRNASQLPIEAINVDAVDLKFWRIHPNEYHKFLKNPNRREYYALNNLNKIADMVYTAQFDIEGVKNKRETHNLSIKEIEELQEPGVYFVTMLAADSYSYQYETSWFAISDIGIHVRRYKDSIAVFAHQIPNAKTYPKLDVYIDNAKGKVIATGVTDESGFVELKASDIDEASLLVASKGDNVNLIRLNKPKMDLSEFSLGSRPFKQQELFLYGPRDLYRPGETVFINGLLRNFDAKLVKASPIKVEVRRPDNRVFKTFNWQGDESSFYQSDFRIPSDALTGQWIFTATLANKEQFIYEFSIEDFLPERLKLELSSGNESAHIDTQENPIIEVQSDYLYGAPAANNLFDASITVSPDSRLFEQYKDYTFGSNNYRDFTMQFNIDSRQLNAEGFAELKVDNNWEGTKFPLKVKSFVNVYETGGRPISRSFTHSVWPYSTAIGVRPIWDGDYASPNSDNEIEIIAINKSGELIREESVNVALVRENSNRYWQWGEDGWSYNSSARNVTVYTEVVNIDPLQKTKILLPLEYGNYRVEIRNNNNDLLSSYRFFSGWRWYDRNSSQGERPDQVKLHWASDALQPGKDAELKITAPYAGTALITVEADGLLWKKTLEMDSSQQNIDIPVDASWQRHDIYASVMVIRKGDTKRKNLPTRSYGIIHLPIVRDKRKLSLTIEHPEKVEPEQELMVKITATNLQANQNAYVTLAAVDSGVLSVSNYKTPKPFDWFFAKRKYLAALHDMYGSLIDLVDGKNARQKFGGDADLERGGDSPLSDVQIVSIFSGKVNFDDEGQAIIPVQLPYFNGEIRLMALAFSEQQYAGKDSLIKVAAPIVIETSLPRFLAKGDKSIATVDIHNTQDFTEVLDVTISADDALGGATKTIKLELNANQKEVIKLPITGKLHLGKGYVHVKADRRIDVAGAKAVSKKISIKRQWGLGLRPTVPAIIDSTKVVIEPGNSYLISKTSFAKFDQSNLKSMLKVSNIPLLNAELHLQQLIQYPYGCLEQTSSRAWPLVIVEKSDFALFESDKQQKIFSERKKLIDGAISRVLGMQRYEGSFGLWSSDSPERPWLTVYATDFLLSAKQAGYSVPETSLNKAIKRLKSYIKNRRNLSSEITQYMSNSEHFDLSFKSYAGYVLAKIKQVNLQDLRKLYDNKNKKAKSPLPLAHLAMALELMGDERRAREAWTKAISFKTDKDRYAYYGDYGSPIRDMSQVILLGMESHLVEDLTVSSYQLLVPLQEQLRNRKWMSTQERGAVFRLAKALKNNAQNSNKWKATLNRNKNEVKLEQANNFLKMWYSKQADSDLTIVNDGAMPIYIDHKVQGYLKNIQPESNGISIERKFYNVQGDPINLAEVTTGDMVLVQLKMTLDRKYNYLPDAMVIDLLPVGLELENQNLAHSFKLDDIKVQGKSIKDWYKNVKVNHAEYRDDRFVAAISLSRYSKQNVFYLARAVTPGEYLMPPTLVEDMYRPEIRAIGKANRKLTVRPK